MPRTLDARLAEAFGVELATAAWLPVADAEPEALLRAAEAIGGAVGVRRAIAPASAPWVALPLRGAAPAPENRRAAIARLLAWAAAGGARWDGIEFPVDAEGNASVRATRALAPGEQIVALPRHLMVFDTELAASTTGDPGLAHPRDALAAWLPLEARAPGSRWRIFLDALPAQLAELPMFRTATDLAALAGTTAYAIADADNRDVRDAYAALPAALGARVSLADFAWGCAIVKSRGYHAPGTLEHRVALLPVVELFNHRPGDTTWTYDPADRLYAVITERAFAIGDEVCCAYADCSDTRLLVQFGFTLADNPLAEAGLLFEPAADPITAVAAHLLWELPLAGPARLRVGCVLDQRFVHALSLARLHVAGPVERARAAEQGLAAYGEMPWLGAALEERALGVIAVAARRALAEVDAHPAPGGRDPWAQGCARVRAAERAVLAQILELATGDLAFLHWRDPARLRAAAEARPEGLHRQYLLALADSAG